MGSRSPTPPGIHCFPQLTRALSRHLFGDSGSRLGFTNCFWCFWAPTRVSRRWVSQLGFPMGFPALGPDLGVPTLGFPALGPQYVGFPSFGAPTWVSQPWVSQLWVPSVGLPSFGPRLGCPNAGFPNVEAPTWVSQRWVSQLFAPIWVSQRWVSQLWVPVWVSQRWVSQLWVPTLGFPTLGPSWVSQRWVLTAFCVKRPCAPNFARGKTEQLGPTRGRRVNAQSRNPQS